MKNFLQKLKPLWNPSHKSLIPGVNSKYTDQILQVIKSYPAVKEVVLYGSRARNDHQKYSDIDLCITKKGEGGVLGLSLELEELNIPYMIDLINYSDVDHQFQNNIDKDGIQIYNK